MKKLQFVILAAMLAFVGCAKKPQDVNVELVTVENEVKTIGSTQARISNVNSNTSMKSPRPCWSIARMTN